MECRHFFCAFVSQTEPVPLSDANHYPLASKEGDEKVGKLQGNGLRTTK